MVLVQLQDDVAVKGEAAEVRQEGGVEDDRSVQDHPVLVVGDGGAVKLDGGLAEEGA